MIQITRTRTSIGSQIREACEQQGRTVETGQRCGVLVYIIDGEPYSPGAAADLVLPGGFSANYGK